MRRLFCLLGVVLCLIFSTPFSFYTMISANDSISNASTAQQDLNAFGLTEEDYILDLDSNRHVSGFLFVEDIEDKETFYYLYLYDPKGFTTVPVNNYLQIQISHLTSNFLNLLNDDDAVERALNYYDLIHISSSDNGTVAKFLIDGLKFSNPKIYRRYQIRQVSYYLNNIKNYYYFGDEYLYETLTDGTVRYEYKKMDYISLYNTECASYYTPNVSFWENLFPYLKAESQQAFFYAFSLPKDLSIDELIDVSFVYEYKKIKGYSYSDEGDFYSTIQPDDPYMITNLKSGYVNEKIEHEDVIMNGTNFNWIFTDSYKVKFDRISSYNDLKKNDNLKFSNFILNNFDGSEYIINFANFEYTAQKNLMLEGPITESKYDKYFRDYLYENGNLDATYYEIIKYDCNLVEVVNLTFNSAGEIFNLDVIVAPIDSKGDYSGSSNPSILDDILEVFNRFRDWLMETFDLDETVATIVAIVLIILSIFILFELVKSLIIKGSVTFISNLCSIIFNGLKVVLKGLFSVFYYLLIYPFKVIFKIGG